MNIFYCMSLGSYMIAAVHLSKDSNLSFILWLVLAIGVALTGHILDLKGRRHVPS